MNKHKICHFYAEPKFIRSGNYQYSLNWFGNGILMVTEAAWTKSRKLMTPAFQLTALREFVDIKNQCAQALIVIKLCLVKN